MIGRVIGVFVSITRITKGIKRRLKNNKANKLCRLQKNPLATINKTVVTTFYDFEADYAGTGKQQPCFATVARILEIEKKHGIHSTYNTVAKLAHDIPDIVKEIHHRGHEIASHSYDHTVLLPLSRQQKKHNVESAKQMFNALGYSNIGHRSPQSAWDFTLVKQLSENNYCWNAENGSEPYPYIIHQTETNKLWRMPVRDDDWYYVRDKMQPKQVLQKWISLVQQARETQSYTAIGFHPWLQASEDKLVVLEEFFAWLAGQDDIAVMPFGEVVNAMESQ